VKFFVYLFYFGYQKLFISVAVYEGECVCVYEGASICVSMFL